LEGIAVISEQEDHVSPQRRDNVTLITKDIPVYTAQDVQQKTSKESFRNHEKPYFVIHIGPVKTGTTTLQCALQSLSQSLKKDGIIIAETESCRPDLDLSISTFTNNLTWTKGGAATYDNVVLGKAFAPNGLGQWSNDTDATGMPECWMQSYVKFAKGHAQQHHSIILSNEILSQTVTKFTQSFVDDLVESLDDFQVVVVVTYRPWFEWVASLQDQMTKNILVRQREWPGNEGGRRIDSLHRFMERQLRYKRQHTTKRQKYPFVDEIIPIFCNHSQIDLKIVDIHEDGDFVTNFVCKTLSGATGTCNALKNTNDTIEDRNKAENKLWYDILAVEAYEKGMVSGSRLRVYNRIRKFQQETLGKTSTDFPKICPPSGFLKRILKESIQAAKRIWPNPARHGRLERRHRRLFARAVEADKFCTINATAVLEDRGWIDFFNRMGAPGQRKQAISQISYTAS
jgi:predicted SnoaL-like aldol condensation-catalyzing enzyme